MPTWKRCRVSGVACCCCCYSMEAAAIGGQRGDPYSIRSIVGRSLSLSLSVIHTSLLPTLAIRHAPTHPSPTSPIHHIKRLSTTHRC